MDTKKTNPKTNELYETLSNGTKIKLKGTILQPEEMLSKEKIELKKQKIKSIIKGNNDALPNCYSEFLNIIYGNSEINNLIDKGLIGKAVYNYLLKITQEAEKLLPTKEEFEKISSSEIVSKKERNSFRKDIKVSENDSNMEKLMKYIQKCNIVTSSRGENLINASIANNPDYIMAEFLKVRRPQEEEQVNKVTVQELIEKLKKELIEELKREAEFYKLGEIDISPIEEMKNEEKNLDVQR